MIHEVKERESVIDSVFVAERKVKSSAVGHLLVCQNLSIQPTAVPAFHGEQSAAAPVSLRPITTP